MATRILLLNDSQDFLNVMQMLLEEEGYQVQTRFEVIHDLTSIVQFHPHLIILDLIFNGEALGFEVLERLRLMPITRDIPIILASADMKRLGEMEEHLKTQNVTIIRKPFDIDTLLQVVHKCIEETQHP
jgi:CheY-like chemotaxis protein